MMESSRDQRWFGLLCLALVLGTFLAYARLWSCDFTAYDDPVYVTENPQVQGGLSLASAVWAFRTSHGGNWHPLTWMSHMLDCQVYGLKPAGHHLTNLLLHSANVLLLFGVLRRLTGALWRSALVAALFAWHPLHAESVAWVAERKDVLSALFWLLTMGAYSRYAEAKGEKHPTPNTQHPISSKSQNPNLSVGRSRLYYTLALTFFALGLLSKPMVVTLPFVLLLLDYWPLARIANSEFQISNWKPLGLEKIPFFALAAGVSVVTFCVQKAGGAVAAADAMPFKDRVANALLACCSYLRKSVWPDDLAAFYPLQETFAAWQVIGAIVFLAAVTTVVIFRRRRQPFLAVGWFWFLGTLVPVSGLVQVGLQSMADRYTYIPLIGIFVMLSWCLAEVLEGRAQFIKLAARTGTAIMLGGCIVLTHAQARTWQNGATLFTHALAVAKDRFAAENNLARALGKMGRYDDAAAHFQAALRLRPDAALPLYNLGILAAGSGKLEAAMDYYRAALRGHPDYTPARFELANLLAVQGRLDEARKEYQECVRTEPDRAELRRNLGVVLLRLGQVNEAVDAFKAARRLEPANAEFCDQLGGALQKAGRRTEAREQFAEAVRLKPEFTHAHLKLGLLLAQEGQFEQAKQHFLEVLQLEPGNAGAYYNLGGVHAAQGQLDQAARAFGETLRLNPADADAHARLGAVLAQSGKPTEALAHFRELVRLQPNPIEAMRLAGRPDEAGGKPDLRNLGLLDQAFAEAGRFEEAIETAEQIQKLAAAMGQTAVAEQAGKRLAAYRLRKTLLE